MKDFLLAVAVAALGLVSACEYSGNMMPGELYPGGATTRYWDCCKMSCSWNKDIPFVNQPVKSCNADGFTEGNNYDTSICEAGGISGSCNDFQPWWDPAHPDLFFMFAAHKNGDLDCCSCVEMTDLSDPNLSGKTIIAQVTNCGTGSELEKHQFDLQIPMSGVGIFGGGCPTQWPGVNFGQTYGGINSEDECQQLYDAGNPLYIGCLFRFRSFKNSDNPSMTYRRVQCPEVLTKLSGCSRSDDGCFPRLEMPLPKERMPYVDTDLKPLRSSDYPTEGSVLTSSSTSAITDVPTTTTSTTKYTTTTSTTKHTTTTEDTTTTSTTKHTTTTSTTEDTATTSTTKGTTTVAESNELCFTELGYYPPSPLYCLACQDKPTVNAGMHVCNAAGNYAPCFSDENACFEGLRGISAPEVVLSADECFTDPSFWPNSEEDCVSCPEHPHFHDNGEWTCRQLSEAPCFTSQSECFNGLRGDL